MKLWFNFYSSVEMDQHAKLGLGWYKHHKNHPWYGFTFELYVGSKTLSIHFVSNWKKYQKKIYRKK